MMRRHNPEHLQFIAEAQTLRTTIQRWLRGLKDETVSVSVLPGVGAYGHTQIEDSCLTSEQHAQGRSFIRVNSNNTIFIPTCHKGKWSLMNHQWWFIVKQLLNKHTRNVQKRATNYFTELARLEAADLSSPEEAAVLRPHLVRRPADL